MNGSRFLLDTNAVVALLAGQGSIDGVLSNAEWVGISVITKVEFLVFPQLDEHDRYLFDEFAKCVDVVGIESKSDDLIEKTIFLRRTYKIKVPDAIIGATALEMGATLLTLDNGFRKVKELLVESWV